MKNILYVLSIIFLFSLVFAANVLSQIPEEEVDKPAFKDKLFFGGGLGLSFGDVTYISIAPVIGYKVTPKLSTGVRLTYQYRRYKNVYPPYDIFESHDFGIGAFGSYMIFGPIFLQVEYEYLSYEYFTVTDTKVRQGFDSFMAGGGIMQPIGRNAGLFLTVLYNFSYKNDNSIQPYGSPLILRAGVTAGF